MNEQQPFPSGRAWLAVGRCVVASVVLLGQRRVHLPRQRVGMRLRFADGTSSRVYRETVVDGAPVAEPCVLVVRFRLRLIRGFGHRLFRLESLLNTLLFVGFPGFVSKLWMTHDDDGVYRGLYQWNGATSAQAYARALWRVLALVSEPASIGYRVLPGAWRDDVLADPRLLDGQVRDGADDGPHWWRPVDVTAAA